ncbi:fizzy-related protein homolog [Convolutriloba macropyga]|uniref:fizzy-related protein homolog n=1 Tax=Convolutriloba macropyga TaxID=536237 RepID=UPI003F526A8A
MSNGNRSDYEYSLANDVYLSKLRAQKLRNDVSPLKVFTPFELASPVKKLYGDRFIPLRTSPLSANLIRDRITSTSPESDKSSNSPGNKRSSMSPYQVLLSEQLLESEKQRKVKRTLFSESKVLSFNAELTSEDHENLDPHNSKYSVNSLTMSSPCSKYLASVGDNQGPKIPKSPLRILDAPSLLNDFYLNILDYSCQNVIGLVLGSFVYLWSDGKSAPLFNADSIGLSPTSLSFNEDGRILAIGSNSGIVQTRDVHTTGDQQPLMNQKLHKNRVGVLTWKGSLLFSGSKSGAICCKDVRMSMQKSVRLFSSHTQEVCGLKCYFDGSLLASGCNDNKVLIWDIGSGQIVQSFEHKAAVRALSWNPHRLGTLTTGGGTNDQTVYHWSTMTGQLVSKNPVGSQITSVFWCKHANYYVTTQGYSTNDIIVWDGEKNEKVSV